MRNFLSLLIIMIVITWLYFAYINRFDLLRNSNLKKGRTSADEITITSERYMFSPMLVRLKKGKKVKLHLITYDIPHGIFQSDLNLNISAYPGKPAEVTLIPTIAGEFTASCSLYCGENHDNMKMSFIVE